MSEALSEALAEQVAPDDNTDGREVFSDLCGRWVELLPDLRRDVADRYLVTAQVARWLELLDETVTRTQNEP